MKNATGSSQKIAVKYRSKTLHPCPAKAPA